MAKSKDAEPQKFVVEFGTSGRIREGIAKWISIFLVCCAIAAAVIHEWSFTIIDFQIGRGVYAYWLLAFFVPIVYLNSPRLKRHKDRIPWYDWTLAAVAFICFFYLGANAVAIRWEGWSAGAPLIPTVISVIISVIMAALGHRIFGTIFFIVSIFFGFYPLFGESMPGIFFGAGMPIIPLFRQMAMGEESLVGMPMRVGARMVFSLGFFVSPLLYLGGGRFFINLALSVIGRFRGGAAKVAVLSSALVATITGGGVSNVLITGSVSIPAMKKSGYSPHQAGATEAVASMGGSVTPPVMGSAAYLMASFLLIEYWKICIYAAVPALLFYLSVFSQIDLYAKNRSLKGMDKQELPSFRQSMKEGWPFVVGML
ncbi:TRAP transporter permease, partial [Chloroflexota bacterium]